MTRWQMTPALSLRHEPFGPELKAEWRFSVIHEKDLLPNSLTLGKIQPSCPFANWQLVAYQRAGSMDMSFFAQCPLNKVPYRAVSNRRTSGSALALWWTSMCAVLKRPLLWAMGGHGKKRHVHARLDI